MEYFSAILIWCGGWIVGGAKVNESWRLITGVLLGLLGVIILTGKLGI